MLQVISIFQFDSSSMSITVWAAGSHLLPYPSEILFDCADTFILILFSSSNFIPFTLILVFMIEISSFNLLIFVRITRTATSSNFLFLFTVRTFSLVIFLLFLYIFISGLIILLLFFAEPFILALFSTFISTTGTISLVFISLPSLFLHLQQPCSLNVLNLQIYQPSFFFLVLNILFRLSFLFELFPLYYLICDLSYFCLPFIPVIITSTQWFFVVT